LFTVLQFCFMALFAVATWLLLIWLYFGLLLDFDLPELPEGLADLAMAELVGGAADFEAGGLALAVVVGADFFAAGELPEGLFSTSPSPAV
jgi:hypothetical protein